MKNRILNFGIFAVLLASLTGCEAIGDIFQAGIGVGIFLVIAVVVIILWVINRFRK